MNYQSWANQVASRVCKARGASPFGSEEHLKERRPEHRRPEHRPEHERRREPMKRFDPRMAPMRGMPQNAAPMRGAAPQNVPYLSLPVEQRARHPEHKLRLAYDLYIRERKAHGKTIETFERWLKQLAASDRAKFNGDSGVQERYQAYLASFDSSDGNMPCSFDDWVTAEKIANPEFGLDASFSVGAEGIAAPGQLEEWYQNYLNAFSTGMNRGVPLDFDTWSTLLDTRLDPDFGADGDPLSSCGQAILGPNGSLLSGGPGTIALTAFQAVVNGNVPGEATARPDTTNIMPDGSGVPTSTAQAAHDFGVALANGISKMLNGEAPPSNTSTSEVTEAARLLTHGLEYAPVDVKEAVLNLLMQSTVPEESPFGAGFLDPSGNEVAPAEQVSTTTHTDPDAIPEVPPVSINKTTGVVSSNTSILKGVEGTETQVTNEGKTVPTSSETVNNSPPEYNVPQAPAYTPPVPSTPAPSAPEVQGGVKKAVDEMQAGTGGVAIIGLLAILGASFYASQKAKRQAGAGG